MGRRRYTWDELKIAKRRRAGHGKGVGESYKPWLMVTDVPSRGRSHRVWCEKTRREHHFLSDNEYFTFLDLWWDDDVVDIREQFPLCRLDTRAIALRRGVTHPVDRRYGTPLVQTTDILVTKRDQGGLKAVAIAVKPAQEMLKKRVRQLLDLERTYWWLKKVEWRLVLDQDVRTQRVRNLDWLFGADQNIPKGLEDQLRRRETALVDRIGSAGDLPVRVSCRRFDEACDLEPGTGLSLLRSMLRRKVASTDLSVDSIPDEPGNTFRWEHTPHE